MSVTIAGQSIKSIAELDKVLQTVLSLIPKALPWLDWAIADQNKQFEFRNGDELAISVQEGIHGTNLLPLEGANMWLNPLVLMPMSFDDLIVIVKSQDTGHPGSDLRKVLQKHGLHHFKTLENASILPRHLGVDESPCFSAMTPGDMLRLADLAADCQPQESAWRTAASFAAGEALDVRGFVAYTKFHRMCRGSDAREVLESLIPHLWSWIKGPVTPTPDVTTLTEAVTNYLQTGGVLGFNDQATAAHYLADHVPLLSMGSQDRPNACAKAVQKVNEAAASFKADTVRISQDGLTRFYTMQSNGLTMERNQSGLVTIFDYPSH